MAPRDLTEFAEFETEKKKRKTRVQAALEQLKKDDRETVEAALAVPNTQISCTAICRWFKKRGLEVPIGAVNAHRRETAA